MSTHYFVCSCAKCIIDYKTCNTCSDKLIYESHYEKTCFLHTGTTKKLISLHIISYEPHHEKTCFWHAKTKAQIRSSFHNKRKISLYLQGFCVVQPYTVVYEIYCNVGYHKHLYHWDCFCNIAEK